jgi:hypothetical protein
MAWRSMVAACSSRNLNSRGRYPEKTGPSWFKTLHEVDGLHSAFTVLAVGEPLLRVARIQSSAAEALSTKATANATTKSVPKSPSVGSAVVMRRAGKKIRRAVAMASPTANARIIHSL